MTVAGRNDLSNKLRVIHAECRVWTESHAVRCCADSVEHQAMHGYVAGSQCASALSCEELSISAQVHAQPSQRIAQAVHQNASCVQLPACLNEGTAELPPQLSAHTAHKTCLALGQRLCHVAELREALGRKFALGSAYGPREPLCGNKTRATEAATWTSSTEGCLAGHGVCRSTPRLS